MFKYCRSLASLTIPASVTSIGSSAFYATPWLEKQTQEWVIVGDGVLLAYNGTDTAVQIPQGVKYLSGAFFMNKGITAVTIPDSVTAIEDAAFDGCTGITAVTIPASVTEIGWSTFYGCESLTIYGKSSSYAESYAKENNIPFAAQ